MNKLLREHVAYRVFEAERDHSMDGLWDANLFPAPRRRRKPKMRKPLPRHEPKGAMLLRRLRKRDVAGQDIGIPGRAALRAIDAEPNRQEGM